MFNTRSERVAMWAGNLFFLAAIALFVTLILLTTGTVKAQEYLITDSLEPDVLVENALDEDALGEDSLGLERFDPELFRQLAAMKIDLPIAEVPPKPRELIPTWFCCRCWVWHRGEYGGLPRICPNNRYYHHERVAPPLEREVVPAPVEKSVEKVMEPKRR